MSDAPLKQIDNECKIDKNDEIQSISTFRRALPQFFGSAAKNLMILNIGEFFGFVTLVIPSLTGLSKELNPNEIVRITSSQASWLTSLAHIAHPIGSVLSGPINDKIGRRKTIMLVNIPLVFCWICLGFSQTFSVICLLFALLGFSFGLKEAPSFTYISEISEPSFRGIMMAMTVISFNLGLILALVLGSIFPWRYVAFLCAITPICCLTAILLVPESPPWLLSKCRINAAQKSLQWLRGWVAPNAVYNEFSALQSYSIKWNACDSCQKQSIKCYHPKPTTCDKLREVKRKRNIRPLILITCLQFFNKFSASFVFEPYIIQVLQALGSPINANAASVWTSGIGISGSIFLLLTVKKLGRRKLYLPSILSMAICSIILSVYGFVLFPSGWMSFKTGPNEPAIDPQHAKQLVGNLGYLMLILIMVMRFATKVGIDAMLALYVGEIFPFKSRSLLCGICFANNHIFSAISTKLYFNIELWLSLPGASLFYGIISFIGFIVMYFIMPETEQRSLEDIELHYTDNSKGITDIFIPKLSLHENK